MRAPYSIIRRIRSFFQSLGQLGNASTDQFVERYFRANEYKAYDNNAHKTEEVMTDDRRNKNTGDD